MTTIFFQKHDAVNEEVLNSFQMIQLKGGIDDKRTSRPGTKATAKTTPTNSKKP